MSDFVIENGVLTKYTGPGGEVVVPEGVTNIGERAFDWCSSLMSVEIPESVTSIGDFAFYRCRSLTSVEIPEGVTNIGEGAFCNCSSLTSVEIPGGVTNIGKSLFSGCSSLTSVEIPESVTSIGDSAFNWCSSLTSVVIPESVTSIGDYAFHHCSSLTSVEIPGGVTNIGESLFSGCSSLTSVEIPEGVTNIGERAFDRCSSLTSVVIPESVTSIGVSAFLGCSSLTRVEIPESVTSIGDYAFCGCSSLTSITIPESVTNIGEGAFLGCSSLADSDGFVIYRNVLHSYSGPGGEVVVPEGVTTIGQKAFYECVELTGIVIPEGVTEIQDWAFYRCGALEHLTLPSSIASIGVIAFGECNRLKHVDLPGQYTAQPIKALVNDLRFCQSVAFHIPESLAAAKESLPSLFCKNEMETTAVGMAYLLLYQNSPNWRNWLLTREAENPAIEFDRMIAIMEEQPFDKKTAKNAALFITRHCKSLAPDRIRKMLAFFDGKKCKEIEELKSAGALQAHLGEQTMAENPAETLAQELLSRLGAEDDAEKAVKKGIRWKDSKVLCSRDILVSLLSCYIREWNRCAEEVNGEMTSMIMLKDGMKVKTIPEADRIAEALDSAELSAFLTKLVKGAKYRPYLLAWARFATEDSINEVCSTFKSMLRGKAKEQYFAQNLEQALLINDSPAAMLFFDRIEKLDRYAAYRGVTAVELRDTAMLPDFGLDADGVKRYDIGGNVIEVRLNDDLSFRLTDTQKNKEIRSMPKKSDDPAKAEEAAKDFTAFKKEIKTFIKLRSEQLCKMHISGDAIPTELWNKVYRKHPVVRRLTRYIVWQDEAGKTFTEIGGTLCTADSAAYEPFGGICVASVLGMDPKDVSAWQQVFSANGQAQLFEQIWEPIIHCEPTELQEQLPGATISTADRNALKSNLSRRGIRVHSGEMDREFNARSWGYDFDGRNTMYLGKCLELDYQADDNGIVIDRLRLSKTYNAHELNVVLLELEKALVSSHIARDAADALNETILASFTAAQIREFLDKALACQATNCTALLMNYKNEHFPEYSAMDEFVLDW